jgi:hypothetical protein
MALSVDPGPNPFAGPAPQFNMPTAPTGGMFGGGGKFGLKEALAFGLAGLVSRRNPDIMNNLMSALMLKQKQQLEEAQYQRHRQDALEDFTKHQQIEQQYAPAPQPGEFERALMASGVNPGTPEWTQAMKTRAANMLDPIVNTPYGPMMRSMVAPQMPTKPVGPLTPLPDDGGPTPQASGGFPGGYY